MPKKHPTLFTRIGNWIHNHRTASIAIAAGLVVIIAGGVGAFLYLQPQKTAPQKQTAAVKKQSPPPPPPKFYSALTGLEVANEAATKQPVTAIMLENSPDARPQSGLKAGGIVFEAIAEGGITRFLALYQQEKPQLVGPVRSLRLYYVDWLAPYNASVAHVGGSLFALQEVRGGKYRDIDQFFNGKYYWRAADRYAPHNVYTSFAKLDALNASKGYNESAFQGFPRKDGTPAAAPNATQIAIKISGPLYNSTYTYNREANTYSRFQGGAPHLDREAGHITANAVVAMHVTMTKILEDGYREQITTIGTGKATIFQDGVATDAVWHKPARSAPLTFTDQAGKPIALNRGQTWITAVPNATGSVLWQ